VRFALSVDGVDAFCTPGDVAVLRLALDAAGGFTRWAPTSSKHDGGDDA